MYTETRSKTITEATDKLYAIKNCDFVFGCTTEQLTETQKEALYEYLDWLDYTHDDANEDRKLALENLYVNLTDNHLYVLEMADDGDDNTEYYYAEIVPYTTLYKDDLGNLWNYVGKDCDFHIVTVVDECDGHYTDTNITNYLTDDELANCTKIEVEV